MAAAAGYGNSPSFGWLKDRRFDLVFICGLTALALAAGVAVVLEPRLLPPILLADLWLLGYHHVVSTYTRLCFDKESLRRYGFLVIGLPFVVAAVSMATVVAAGGLWIIVSIYFYWQWFHYTRQSWGIAQSYRRKAGHDLPAPSLFDTAIFYAVPVAGVLNRSAEAPATFLFMPIHMAPVPAELAAAAGVIAALLVGVWLVQAVRQWLRGDLSIPYALFQLSHHAIFGVAYILMPDITVGWLVINIWHNAQYVLFVWLFNNRRFQAGRSDKARLLSVLSQNGRMIWYLGFCLVISTALYWSLGNLLPVLLAAPVFIIYHIINFHHYIVDAIIWRSAEVRRALQSTG